MMVLSCGRREAPRARAGTPVDSGRTASAAGESSPNAAARRHRILIIGTSLTAGYGLEDPDQSYPADLQRRIDSLGLSYQVVNAGVSGETSAGALRGLDWWLREPADIVIIETGANDGLRGLSVDSMRANIQAIIDRVKARDPRARIVLAGMEAPPNMGPRYTAAFRSVFPDLARRNGATLIPFLLAGVAGVDTLNQADGIHPNARGAELVAANVWRVLGPMLEASTAGAGEHAGAR